MYASATVLCISTHYMKYATAAAVYHCMTQNAPKNLTDCKYYILLINLLALHNYIHSVSFITARESWDLSVLYQTCYYIVTAVDFEMKVCQIQ